MVKEKPQNLESGVKYKTGENLINFFEITTSEKMEKYEKDYSNLVIIEVKQERINRASPIVKALKNKSINPYRISKYCIGMTHVYPQLKYNRFKRKLIKINNLTA